MRSRAVSHGMSGAPRPSRAANPSEQRQRLRAPELHRAQRPAELHDLHARPQLRQPLLVPGQLRRPHRGLEPERDRQAGLAVGAPAHHGVAVAPGERDTRRRGSGRGPVRRRRRRASAPSRTTCRRGPARSRRSTPTRAPPPGGSPGGAGSARASSARRSGCPRRPPRGPAGRSSRARRSARRPRRAPARRRPGPAPARRGWSARRDVRPRSSKSACSSGVVHRWP